MDHHCNCKALVRIITGKDYKRLEFFGTHDKNSHANDASKKLKYNQIGAIYDSSMIAPKQSATQLRRNLMQAKGSPDKPLHMDPAQLLLIQRRVRSASQELTKQKLDTATVPESLGKLIRWCADHDFHAALAKHNDPNDDYCLPLFSAFVIGSDIKMERQAIHINLSAPWFLMNAIRALESGWTVQLNGNATFGFCRVAVDMIGLGFCSMGAPTIPHVGP